MADFMSGFERLEGLSAEELVALMSNGCLYEKWSDAAFGMHKLRRPNSTGADTARLLRQQKKGRLFSRGANK